MSWALTDWVWVSGLGSALMGLAAFTADRFVGRAAPRLVAALWWCAMLRLVIPPSIGVGHGWIEGPAQNALSGPGTIGAPVAAATGTPLFYVWLSVATVLALRTITSLVKDRRSWGRASLTLPRPSTDRTYARAAAAMGIARRPVLRVSRELGPACVGIIRPRIIIPRPLEAAASSADLEAALLHELSHARRRDGVRRLMATALRTLFWFHPVPWIAERRLAVLAELTCDRMASAAASGGAAAYRTSLLGFAAAHAGVTRGPAARSFHPGWGATSGELVQRLQALSTGRNGPKLRSAACIAFLGLSAAVVGPAPQVIHAAPAAGPSPEPTLAPAHPLDELKGSLQKRYAVMAALAKQRKAAATAQTP